MKIAFIAGLNNKKIAQKTTALEAVGEIDSIDLFRRSKFESGKIRWVPIAVWIQNNRILSEIVRFMKLIFSGYKYDIIIGCEQAYHGVWAWIAGILWKKPVIQLINTDVDAVFNSRLLKRVVMSSAACGVRGPVSQQKLREKGYNKPIIIISNTYRAPEADNHKPADKLYDFIAVSNYTFAKDYPWMFEVLSAVRQKCPEFKVAIVGPGYKTKFKGLTERHGLNGNIVFFDYQDEEALKTLYRKSRALILTSKVEGLPMVVIEAMSFGLPVFTTAVGELSWLIKDKIEGRIFQHGNTKDAAQIIADELKHKEHFNIMGQNAKQRFNELSPQFCIEEVAKSWEMLLKSCRSEKVLSKVLLLF